MSPADHDRDVLTSLPNARPTRRSAKRAPRAEAAGEEAPKKPATPRKTAPRKPAAARKTAAAKPKAAAAPKPKAAAPAAATPKAAETPKPRATVPPAGWASPREERAHDGSTGDLIGTAVQAVGELAQIGLTYGGQALRQALSRLPRP
jgi:hypothetical protein